MLAYCILHYKNAAVTTDCIDSLLRINADNDNFRIVVIDNGSDNHSYETLGERYDANLRITLLRTHINEGFAKGNNIAYEYARDILGCDVIVVMNSDILVDNRFSASMIEECSRTTSADIISPDIVTPAGIHQSPLATKRYPITQNIIAYLKNLALIFILSIPGIKNRIYQKYSETKKDRASVKRQLPDFDKTDFIPHGSCIIYSGNWIRNESMAFLPYTFLFTEEEFLYEYLKRKKYMLRFCPELIITHLGGATTKSETKTGIKNLVFRSKKQNESLLKLIRYKLTHFHG